MNTDSNAEAANTLHRDLSTAVIAFHEAVARRVGMTAADRKCLGVLWKLGTCTPGQLASATGLTTGAITGIADRLEKAGYLSRRANPRDRRSTLLKAERREELEARIGPLFDSLSRAMAKVAAGYTEAEQAAIHRYLAEATEALRAELAELQRCESGSN